MSYSPLALASFERALQRADALDAEKLVDKKGEKPVGTSGSTLPGNSGNGQADNNVGIAVDKSTDKTGGKSGDKADDTRNVIDNLDETTYDASDKAHKPGSKAIDMDGNESNNQRPGNSMDNSTSAFFQTSLNTTTQKEKKPAPGLDPYGPRTPKDSHCHQDVHANVKQPFDSQFDSEETGNCSMSGKRSKPSKESINTEEAAKLAALAESPRLDSNVYTQSKREAEKLAREEDQNRSAALVSESDRVQKERANPEPQAEHQRSLYRRKRDNEDEDDSLHPRTKKRAKTN